MAYFLGRDVDVYLTLETAAVVSGLTVSSDLITFAANTASPTIPSMPTDATVLSGAVSDVTGVDLSIGISDEDVGPFFGQLATQKIEIRKETTVSLTRKKSNSTFDTLFNGPSTAVDFEGTATAHSVIQAARMGARFGIQYSGSKFYISEGLTNPTAVTESGATTTSCYGYRLHVRLKDDTSGEIFVVRNCAYTGHTVSLNADGTSEETLEFTATTTPYVHTPTGADDFYIALTPVNQM